MVLIPLKLNAVTPFSDVPAEHWATAYIEDMRRLGITSGMGDGSFGMGRQITRAEFITMLLNLTRPGERLESAGFQDVEAGAWFHSTVNTAKALGFTDMAGDSFRPHEPITREEMAVMIINSLGYEQLALRLNVLGPPFTDVSRNMGIITIARDLNIIAGISPSEFGPSLSATREQAAAMMMRMYNLKDRPLTDIHGYYAIAAFNQAHMLADMTAVSFGWGLLEIDGSRVLFNTGAEGDNEFRIPQGYEIPWNMADHAERLLMIAVRESDSPVIINNPDLREQALSVIAETMHYGLETPSGGRLHFDGVSLNFEALRGAQTRDNYTAFVRALRERIGNHSLYLTVQPPRRAGHVYFDGYDFRALGAEADRIILMAHDYNARVLTEAEMAAGVVMTALAPLDEVYFALRALTNPETGVADLSRIMLQINFATAQWKTVDGAVINPRPFTPSYEAIAARIRDGAELRFDESLYSPFITFFDSSDNTNNIVWLEDARSVKEKIRLAGLFGVQGVSLWRLGIVPDFSDIEKLRVFEVIADSL